MDLRTVQTDLNALGFGPLTIDGTWGPQTEGAALTFRSWADLAPAADLTQAAIVDAEFTNAITAAMMSGSATGSGGASGSATPSSTLSSSLSTMTILGVGLLGVGALLLFRKRR